MGLKENIKKRRLELHLTLEDVAKQLGVTRQTIQKYESGIVTNIPSDKIELLAKALKTTPTHLMGWDQFNRCTSIDQMSVIGPRLKEIRESLNVPLQELAKAACISLASLKKIEDGQVPTDLTLLKKICALLSIDYDKEFPGIFDTTDETITVYGSDGWGSGKIINSIDYCKIRSIEPLPITKQIPILGTIACGIPVLATENIDGYVALPENVRADFCLRCKGDSMINARILDGDLVLIRQQPDVDDGQIAAVLIDDEATLKRVYHNPDGGITLVAENSAYAPMTFSTNHYEEIRILGKAVAFLSDIR